MKCTALYGLFSCNLLKFCSNSHRHTGPSPETAMSIAICARLTLDRQHDYTILLDVGTVWLADAAACSILTCGTGPNKILIVMPRAPIKLTIHSPRSRGSTALSRSSYEGLFCLVHSCNAVRSIRQGIHFI